MFGRGFRSTAPAVATSISMGIPARSEDMEGPKGREDRRTGIRIDVPVSLDSSVTQSEATSLEVRRRDLACQSRFRCLRL